MRATILLALVSLALLGQLVSARQSSLSSWAQFKRQHGKVYADQAEDARRFSLFLAAKDIIERHNANASHSYKLGLNHLSDWTAEELGQNIKPRPQEAIRVDVDEQFISSILDSPAPIPDELDWRKVPNRVSPVANQGNCRAGHVFAVAGLLEGQQVARNFTKKLVPLSAQNLLDCCQWASCGGGDPVTILREIGAIGGVMADRDYKYVAPADSWCHSEPSKIIMTSNSYQYVNVDQAEVLKKLVALYGPVGTDIHISSGVQHYKSGVYSEKCKGQLYDQPMLIVGYGTDPKHGDYWILKNSWGSEWGEAGYMRIARGSDVCCVEYMPYMATF